MAVCGVAGTVAWRIPALYHTYSYRDHYSSTTTAVVYLVKYFPPHISSKPAPAVKLLPPIDCLCLYGKSDIFTHVFHDIPGTCIILVGYLLL